MAIKCNTCGGDMIYSIKKKYLKCQHCDEVMQIEDLPVEDSIAKEAYSGEELGQIETTIFQCPECGAEVRSFQEEITIYCPYCGKQANVKQKENAIRPKYILPFTKERREIKKKYQDYMHNKMFVPKELKNPDYIKEYRGIYIPHWSLSYETNDTIVYDGVRSYTSGGYDYRETYEVEARINGPIENVAFDASKAFDDAFAHEIAPFKTKDIKPFHEGYVAGFYADKETVDSQAYEQIAREVIDQKIKDDLIHSRKGNKIYINKCKKTATFRRTAADLILLPVWFLTYRNKDRVSYSIVNGQTGKMSMDLPVDKKSFFGFSALLALGLSILFTILFSTILSGTTATTISYYSLFMLYVSSLITYSESKAIYEREHHIENIGKSKKAELLKLPKGPAPLVAILLIVTIFMNFKSGSGTTRPTFSTFAIALFLAILHICLLIKSMKYSKWYEKLSFFVSLGITFIGLCLYVISFANDWFYYGLSMLSVIGIIINALCCIKGFNYLTSRPVPNFFERKGARHYE